MPNLVSRPLLRVLLVDDDEEDYIITRELLSEVEATQYDVTWISNPDDTLQQLSLGQPFDICLLDYRMGRRNGLDVLKEIVAAGYTLPIILLTGQDDSHVDREAVRLGASDYLVKGQADAVLLERSIRYAIRQKRTEEELRQQTDFVSAVLNTAGALVIVLDRDKNIVRFNRACEQVSGYSFSEVQGKSIFTLVPPDAVDAVGQVFERLQQGDFPFDNENDWLTRDNERRRITFSNTCLLDREGNVEYIVATGIDVTDQRRAEAALHEARERELEVGASIQKTLLVRSAPEGIPGIEFGSTTQAAQRVGGDYLDFFVYEDQCVDVLVGDVMGKGVPAALLAAATKNHFQRVVRRLVLDLMPFHRLPEPQEIVAAVHNVLSPELYRLCSFVTLNYARFDLQKRMVTYVDCGHPSPLVLSASGERRVLVGDNMPLGLNLTERYHQVSVPFAPGDLFFFYSDGLYEATNPEAEPFGMDRLVDAVDRFRDLLPSEIAVALCAEVDLYATGGTVDDDQTCVVVRIPNQHISVFQFSHRIEISASLASLDEIRDFIESNLRRLPSDTLSEEEDYCIALAVHEAAANIIRHAYQHPIPGHLKSEDLIQVAFFSYDDHVAIELRDRGTAFSHPDRIPTPVFDGTREGGFGMFLMRQAVDEITYRRDDFGQNVLRLTKRFGSVRQQTNA